jgi:hypothetical protein
MNRINTVPSIEVTHEPPLKTWAEYCFTLALIVTMGLLVLLVLGPAPMR